jgi:hypothetical protein
MNAKPADKTESSGSKEKSEKPEAEKSGEANSFVRLQTSV